MHKYTRVARWSEGKDLLLVKKDMLHFIQDVKAVRGMGQGISDHHIVLCKVRLVGAWIKRREVVVGTRKIRSEKLREQQYKEGLLRGREKIMSSICRSR